MALRLVALPNPADSLVGAVDDRGVPHVGSGGDPGMVLRHVTFVPSHPPQS